MKRKSYTVSSSDEESTKTAQQTSTSLPTTDNSNDQLEEILKNNKVEKLNFKSWKSCNTLFYDDISGDDEIYLVQCPKNTDLTALNNNVDFESAVSSIKCRINGSREKLTVYSVDDFPSQVNLALPNRATKSFKLKVEIVDEIKSELPTFGAKRT